MAFKPLADNEKVLNLNTTVAETMWSSVSNGILTTFYTGSTQDSNNGKYYYDIHGTDDQTTDVEFAISYGHRLGSGSEASSGTGTNPTKAIYSQIRQVMLPAQTTKFDFNGGGSGSYESDDIFILSVNRARYREKMDPGNWELHLISGSTTIKLIDDSGANKNPAIGNTKREFNVVTGSIANGVKEIATTTATATNSGSYGLFYPESGMIILNPNALQSGSGYDNSRGVIEAPSISADSNSYDHRKFLYSIQSGSYFSARREEQKRSSMYFCSVRANEYNHSQNPSFFTGSNAELVNSSFVQEPVTYITTVGLYNDNNELLAVAKLSKPFKKDSNTEALIKVRLDY
tara:strand:+ start:278 stop:1315 length:1038 start_codon:yes stop_codon:yes gene_type:complete